MRRDFVALLCLLAAGVPASADEEKQAVDRIAGFRVIGHRGAAGHAPENTLAAIERALELGAPEVELDVQLSSDGVLVLYHDSTLDEKTGLTGRVRDHPASALRAADIGSWFDASHPEAPQRFAGTPLATLAEALERFGPRLHYHLEIKAPEPEIPDRLLAVIGARGLETNVTITSFHVEQLERVRARNASIPICLLIEPGEDPAQGIDLAAARGFQTVGVRARDLRRDQVERARARGLSIRAWGLRSDADLEHVLAVGADGATLDWPERALGRHDTAGS